MGAIAEAMVAYAQPLLDQTDGSHEQMNRALSISSFCYTLAQLTEERRDERLRDMQSSIGMNDEEFEDFQSSIILPMIERYNQMFSKTAHIAHSVLASVHSTLAPAEFSGRTQPMTVEAPAKKSEPLPYAPCPCNSGKKYKF